MNTCVERVFGMFRCANVTKPRLLDCVTESSEIFSFCHFVLTAGSPLIPNWTMKPSMARKNRVSSKKPALTRL